MLTFKQFIEESNRLSTNMNTRDARKKLTSAGYTVKRRTGPHEIWHHPEKGSFPLPVHPSKPISPGVALKISRVTTQ